MQQICLHCWNNIYNMKVEVLFLKKKIFFPLHIYSPVNYTPTKMTVFTVVLFIILTAIKKVTC